MPFITRAGPWARISIRARLRGGPLVVRGRVAPSPFRPSRSRLAAELKLRAERRIGELLAETVEHGGGWVARRDSSGLPADVTRSQSSRWQGVASMNAAERVALKRAIEARIGERRGRPSKNIPQSFGELNDVADEVPKGVETAEYAATRAGFDSEWTARQAERVVETGAPELVAAVESGTVSVSAAQDRAGRDFSAQPGLRCTPCDSRAPTTLHGPT